MFHALFRGMRGTRRYNTQFSGFQWDTDHMLMFPPPATAPVPSTYSTGHCRKWLDGSESRHLGSAEAKIIQQHECSLWEGLKAPGSESCQDWKLPSAGWKSQLKWDKNIWLIVCSCWHIYSVKGYQQVSWTLAACGSPSPHFQEVTLAV